MIQTNCIGNIYIELFYFVRDEYEDGTITAGIKGT